MNERNDVEYVGYQPGGLATLCALQSAYYAQAWGFGPVYESKVAGSIAEFLQRFTPEQDFVQLIRHQSAIKGGIVIDSRDGRRAQLHWFIVAEDLQGSGAGRKLIANAMAFVRKKGYPQVYLTTFQGLDAARYLYEDAGFQLTKSEKASTWGREVVEQQFDWYADGETR
ncbi:MAG: GNAT family N-acetyltransferase [Rhodospirillales bacterium]|nr:GNAT family N-acetyltransferase [Rhodospirillales bacterium]